MSSSLSIWLAKSRQAIITTILTALEELTTSKNSGLLILWGGRGVGKTLLLDITEESIEASNSKTAVQRWDLSQHSPDDIRTRISNCINATESNQSQVVLLDNFDLLLRNDPDGSDFFDIEREVFLPAVEKGSCLFIVTSQIELTQWREDEVRLRQQSCEITSLSRLETNTLIPKLGLDTKKLYDSTFGHPKAIDWLLKEPKMSEEELSIRAFNYFLEGLNPGIQKLAEQVCLMPMFNPFLLRLIASQDDSDGSILYLNHLDQIRELIGVGLIFWDISIGAYRFRDNAVRRLLARKVRVREPQLFRDVNKIASDYYKAEARSASFLHRHLVSAVYHLANTLIANNDYENDKKYISWVCDNLSHWIGAQWDEVLKMWVNGANNPALSEEMKDLISIESFEKITDCLKTAHEANS